jgi:hypothetical protein
MQPTCSLQRISIKMKHLALALQSMGQKQIDHMKSQFGIAKEILHKLEIAQDARLLSNEEEWLRREAKRCCMFLASLERTMACLRSRIRFLKDGDANTSLFHRHVGFIKAKKIMPKLIKEDQIFTKHEDKQEIMDSYQELLGHPFTEPSL